MPFPYAEHHQKLVNHLIWLESIEPVYAMWALDQVRKEPSGLYRDILKDVKAEKARRLTCPEPAATSPTASPW